jgi:hypothetical protein
MNLFWAARAKCDSDGELGIFAQIQNVAALQENRTPNEANAKSLMAAIALNHFRCGKPSLMYI